MAAAGGGKIKFKGKCESGEGGRGPVEETRRLEQKEDPRVRGRARRGGAEVSRSEGKWEGRTEKEARKSRREKKSQKRTLAVWWGKKPSSQGH